MTTPVFLTIDTEFAWRHHVAGLEQDEVYRRSLEPAGVGLAYQLRMFERYGLKACFFVDPMPAGVFGLDVVRRMVEPILAAGQEVQLHVHPHWAGASLLDRQAHGRLHLHCFGYAEQLDMLGRATELLMAAGAPRPIAFRAGSYGADDATLRALAALGFVYDSSHNGAESGEQSRIGLPPRQIAPIMREVVEAPVTVIEDAPGRLRPFQPCALSRHEALAALDHAIAADHAALTIVSHSFELANRAGTRANAVHVRRFETLCAALAERRARLPTTHFRDRPALALDHADRPLAAAPIRRRARQMEQLWSNWVAERRL